MNVTLIHFYSIFLIIVFMFVWLQQKQTAFNINFFFFLIWLMRFWFFVNFCYFQIVFVLNWIISNFIAIIMFRTRKIVKKKNLKKKKKTIKSKQKWQKSNANKFFYIFLIHLSSMFRTIFKICYLFYSKCTIILIRISNFLFISNFFC